MRRGSLRELDEDGLDELARLRQIDELAERLRWFEALIERDRQRLEVTSALAEALFGWMRFDDE